MTKITVMITEKERITSAKCVKNMNNPIHFAAKNMASPPTSPQQSPVQHNDNLVQSSPIISPASSHSLPDHESVNISIRERIWSGCVPVLFSMASNEVISKKDPVSIFLSVPRVCYLPLVTQKVHTHFAEYAPALSDGMWFEFNGDALKWNFPIGVLYDLYVETDDPVWRLTVHFQSYPNEDVIMRCDSKDAVKICFFNYLKQAVFLAFNNINCVSALNKNDQDALWSGVCKADYNLYFPIYRLLFGRLQHQNSKMIRYPFRIILRGFNINVDMVPIQRPVQLEEDDSLTLKECLSQIVPGVMERMQQKANIRVVVQGMKVPLDVPMIWLTRHAMHADCFLYVLIVKS